MTRQIAVHLDDELAAFVDGEVRCGRASSRSAVIVRALTRERRRSQARRDIEILTQGTRDDDLDGLAAHGASTRLSCPEP